VPHNKTSKSDDSALLADITREMAKPRISKSVRDEDMKRIAVQVVPVKRSKSKKQLNAHSRVRRAR
jgi:hypothetical protein